MRSSSARSVGLAGAGAPGATATGAAAGSGAAAFLVARSHTNSATAMTAPTMLNQRACANTMGRGVWVPAFAGTTN